MNVNALEAIDLHSLLYLQQRFFDAKRIVAGEAHEALWIAHNVLCHLFKLCVHVHPLVAIRPHLALRDEDLLDAGLIHFRNHRVDAVILRQAANGFFHTADQLARFRHVPFGDEFRRRHVVHEVDGFDSVPHLLIPPNKKNSVR